MTSTPSNQDIFSIIVRYSLGLKKKEHAAVFLMQNSDDEQLASVISQVYSIDETLVEALRKQIRFLERLTVEQLEAEISESSDDTVQDILLFAKSSENIRDKLLQLYNQKNHKLRIQQIASELFFNKCITDLESRIESVKVTSDNDVKSLRRDIQGCMQTVSNLKSQSESQVINLNSQIVQIQHITQSQSTQLNQIQLSQDELKRHRADAGQAKRSNLKGESSISNENSRHDVPPMKRAGTKIDSPTEGDSKREREKVQIKHSNSDTKPSAGTPTQNRTPTKLNDDEKKEKPKRNTIIVGDEGKKEAAMSSTSFSTGVKSVDFEDGVVSLFVPSMSSDNEQGYECVGSSDPDNKLQRFQAFCDNVEFGYGWESPFTNEWWLGIKLPKPKVANFFVMTFGGNSNFPQYSPLSFQIEGSANGKNYQVLSKQTIKFIRAGEKHSFKFTNENGYVWYRILVKKSKDNLAVRQCILKHVNFGNFKQKNG